MNRTDIVTIDTPVLVLIGPTAIGKTALSLDLADKFGCEIISVDSMQVYRHMDIGTAKPSKDEQRGIPHHLIDIVDPDEQFDAEKFVTYALRAIDLIIGRGNIPLLTGGTGMYLKALLHGLFDLKNATDPTVRQNLATQLDREGHEKLYLQLTEIDPVTAARIHPNDTQRLLRALEIFHVSGKPWVHHLNNQPSPSVRFNKIFQMGLACDRDILYARIEKRSVLMLEAGLVQEVEGLRKMGYTSNLTSMQSIGYRHINNYIDGIWDFDETLRLLVRDTRRYAKRQLTWFGNDPDLQWFDPQKTESIIQRTDSWLNG